MPPTSPAPFPRAAASRIVFKKTLRSATVILELAQHLHKIAEQVLAVVRTGRRLGVVLHRKRRAIGEANSFHRAIVQIEVCDFHIFGEGFGSQRETMVLRGDFDPTGVMMEHGLIGSPMAEFQFVDFAANRQPE